MSPVWKSKVSAWWRACLLTAPDLWREPAGTLRGPDTVLRIALRPSPLVARFARGCLILATAYPVELLLQRQWLMGTLLMGVAVVAFRLRLRARPASTAPWPTLEMSAGEWILGEGSTLQTVSLHTASMKLGAWIVLVVRRKHGVSTFLLGPDNLPAKDLAALRRRLIV